MAFQLLKPEIESISRETWNVIKKRWQFWSIVLFSLILFIWTLVFLRDNNDFANFLIFPVFPVWIYFFIAREKVRTSFWKKLAEINGWKYKNAGDAETESGVMFKQGHSRKIYHLIEGEMEGRQFEIFNYQFVIGYGRHQKMRLYTVFIFKFKGRFPHIYLNNRRNKYQIRIGEELPLPAEFEKNFSLSVPKEYEIEALEIFTNEILLKLLDGKFTYDIEFVDQQMIIFTDGMINNSEDLDTRIKQVLELEDLMDEKLDRFEFQKIGDIPYNL